MAKRKKLEDILALGKEIFMFDSFDDYEVDDLIQVLQAADDMYFNGEQSFITDEQYDALRRYCEQAAPDDPYFLKSGSAVRGEAVKLPYPMGSLDQIYEGQVEKWVRDRKLTDENVVLSEKLDGASTLVIFNPDGTVKIGYSKGDGIEGADQTRHLVKIKSIPHKFPTKVLHAPIPVVRAELIISRTNFLKLAQLGIKSRSGRPYKNPRNMISGLMNAEKNDPVVYKYIDFIAYEIVGSSDDKSTQLRNLKAAGFKVVEWTSVKGSTLNDTALSGLLAQARGGSDYEMDGLVIDADLASVRERLEPTRDTLNPAYATKYKVADAANLAVATVRGVEWRISKHSVWKPRVNVEPVELPGVTVRFATGFNAKYIYDNKIGPGAKIEITRSGDVIPYIVRVVEPAQEAQMPSGEWVWGESGVEAVMSDSSDNLEVLIRQAVDFFTSIDAPGLKAGSIRTMAEHYGYKNITDALVHMITLPERGWRETIGANGGKIYTGLREKLTDIPLYRFVGASPYFGHGIGVRKWKKAIVALKVKKVKQLVSLTVVQICSIPGFEKTTAMKMIQGLGNFMAFYDQVHKEVTFEPFKEVPTEGIMAGQKVCFSDVRSKELEAKIVDEGGEIASGVSSKTTILVTPEQVGKLTTKMQKAKELGIKMVTIRQMETMLA